MLQLRSETGPQIALKTRAASQFHNAFENVYLKSKTELPYNCTVALDSDDAFAKMQIEAWIACMDMKN